MASGHEMALATSANASKPRIVPSGGVKKNCHDEQAENKKLCEKGKMTSLARSLPHDKGLL